MPFPCVSPNSTAVFFILLHSTCLFQQCRFYKRPDCTISSISSRKKTTMLLGNWLYYLFLFDLRVYHVKLCKAVLIRCLMLSIADENREDDAAAKILPNFFQIVLKYIYISRIEKFFRFGSSSGLIKYQINVPVLVSVVFY